MVPRSGTLTADRLEMAEMDFWWGAMGSTTIMKVEYEVLLRRAEVKGRVNEKVAARKLAWYHQVCKMDQEQ